jgi:hypothetical protein
MIIIGNEDNIVLIIDTIKFTNNFDSSEFKFIIII